MELIQTMPSWAARFWLNLQYVHFLLSNSDCFQQSKGVKHLYLKFTKFNDASMSHKQCWHEYNNRLSAYITYYMYLDSHAHNFAESHNHLCWIQNVNAHTQAWYINSWVLETINMYHAHLTRARIYCVLKSLLFSITNDISATIQKNTNLFCSNTNARLP